jgi:hypothetical protein
MNLSSPRAARFFEIGKNFGIGALCLALLLAVVTCRNERENGRIAALQSQSLNRIGAFRESGAALDKKVAAFNDAAAERRRLQPYRDAVRDALADHASRVVAIRDVLGSEKADAYLNSMKDVQTAVEATKDQTTPGPIITALSKMVVAREAIAKDADDAI